MVQCFEEKNKVRFIIFTHQREGSHFLRNLLTTPSRKECGVAGKEKIRLEDVQRGTCGTKEKWAKCVKKAYNELEYDLFPHARAVGFTLQGNEIYCSKKESRPKSLSYDQCISQFAQWAFEDANIKIIHLIREAVLMTVSSMYLSNILPVHKSMTSNASIAAEQHQFALNHRMPITNDSLHQIDRLESKFSTEKSILSHTSFLKKKKKPHYHYIRYESLLDHRLRESILRDTFHFLDLYVSDDIIRFQFESHRFLELHPSTCASRVLDWEQGAKLRLTKRTRTACHNLDLALKASSSHHVSSS